MATGRISATPQEIQGTARVFKTNADNTQNMLRTLRREVDGLKQKWEGSAQNTFIQKYDSLQGSLNEFVKVLDGISGQLNGVANTMIEVDQQLSRKLR